MRKTFQNSCIITFPAFASLSSSYLLGFGVVDITACTSLISVCVWARGASQTGTGALENNSIEGTGGGRKIIDRGNARKIDSRENRVQKEGNLIDSPVSPLS